jgi:tetratricopeptide (TPR) repeat protein
MFFKRILAFSLSIVILLIVACASIHTQLGHYKIIEEDFSTRFYGGAAEQIEKAGAEGKYQAKDRLLFYLDMGMALHLAGRYQESNSYLDKAEIAIEENFTKSISKILISFLLNDNVLDYAGEDYEDIFINVIKSLNYIHLNKSDDAMVEVRRTNLKLSKLRDKYGGMAKKLSEGKKPEVNEKAFSVSFTPGETDLRYSAIGSYISMLGYANMGKWDDAEIDRRNIVAASSGRLGYFANKVLVPQGEDAVPVYTLCFAGKSPAKVQSVLLLDFDPDLDLARVMLPGKKNVEMTSFKYEGEDELHLKFAVPKIVRRKSGISGIRTLVNGSVQEEMCLIEDFANVAEETFNVKKPIIYLRAAIRTLLKAMIDAKAKKDIDEKHKDDKVLAGFLKFAVDAVTDVTENADLRCWRTMPGKVYGGKIDLLPGEYEITFEYINECGEVVDLEKKIVTINKNDMNLIEGVSYK